MNELRDKSEKQNQGDHKSPLNTPVHLHFLEATIIFIVLTSVFFLTYSGTFRADDEHILAARAQSYAFWNTLDSPQAYGNDRVRSFTIVPENIAPPVVAIEPGQAYLGAALFRLSSQLEIGGIQAFFMLNIFATALTGCIVYLTVIALGITRRVAFFTGLTYGLCTMAWPYAKTGFRDPVAALFLSISFLGWIIFYRSKSKSIVIGYFIFIIGLALSMFVKINSIVFVPALLISGLLLHKILDRSRWIRWMLGVALIALLILIAAAVLHGTGTLSRYSMHQYLELIARYWTEIDFTTVIAFVGPFLSPAKNIFLYSPILLMLPWVLKKFWRGASSTVFPIILTVIFFAFAQALHLDDLWAGVLFWGLRHMLPVLPLLMILMAPILEQLLIPGLEWERILGWSLLGVSFLVQLGGAVVRWAEPFRLWTINGMDFQAPNAVWSIKYNVIPIHLKSLFHPSSWDIAWVRTLGIDIRVLVIPVLALLLISIGFVIGLYQSRILKSHAMKITIGLIYLIIGFATPIYPGLKRLTGDPLMGGSAIEIMTISDQVSQKAVEGDLIVVDSYGTRLWYQIFNNWNSSVKWFSLPYEIPGTSSLGMEVEGSPSPATLALFTGINPSSERLLYLTSSESPDYGMLREEMWLTEHFNHVETLTEEGEWIVKLSIFSR